MASVKIPNYGLLNGLAAGLNAGLDGFMAAKKMQRDDKTTKMLMLKSGLIENDDGSIDYSPEEKLKRQTEAEATRAKMANDRLGTEINARKAGFLVTDSGLQKDPEFVDYRKALMDLKAKVMEGEIDKAEYDRQERILKLHAQMAAQGYEPEMIPDMTSNTIDGGLGAPAPTTYKPSGKWLKSPDKALKDALGNLKEQASKDKLMAETEGVQFDVADKKPGSGARFQGLLDNRYGKGKINASQLSAQDVTKMFPGLEGTYREQIRPQKPVAAGKVKKSVGADAADRNFAKEYVSYVGGGRKTLEESINVLKQAKATLQSGDNYSGPLAGYRGFGSSAVSPKSVALEQQIWGAISSGLKETMGGSQISNADLQAYKERAFKPTVEEADNVKALDSIIRTMEEKLKEKDSAVQHWEANDGTLSGWKSGKGGGLIGAGGGGGDLEAKRKRLMELRAKKAAAGKK